MHNRLNFTPIGMRRSRCPVAEWLIQPANVAPHSLVAVTPMLKPSAALAMPVCECRECVLARREAAMPAPGRCHPPDPGGRLDARKRMKRGRGPCPPRGPLWSGCDSGSHRLPESPSYPRGPFPLAYRNKKTHKKPCPERRSAVWKFSDFRASRATSALRPEADVVRWPSECPLIARNGSPELTSRAL